MACKLCGLIKHHNVHVNTQRYTNKTEFKIKFHRSQTHSTVNDIDAIWLANRVNRKYDWHAQILPL